MKSIIETIVWALAVIGSMALVGFAGYHTLHTADREQSGWGMGLFISLFLLTILLDLADSKNNWLLKIVGVLCVVLAILFGAHYFGGDIALKNLLQWFGK